MLILSIDLSTKQEHKKLKEEAMDEFDYEDARNYDFSSMFISEDDEDDYPAFAKGGNISPDDMFELSAQLRGLFPDMGDDPSPIDQLTDEGMTGEQYHNKAVSHSRRGNNRLAVKICESGLSRLSRGAYEEAVKATADNVRVTTFSALDVDLLADTIQFSLEMGDMPNAATHYIILKEYVPLQRWNWRAYTFSFDFLLRDDPLKNETECRELIANFKKHLPFDEHSSVAESELEAALGNWEKSMDVLKDAIQALPNACQCAIRLADMQMDRGLYSDVLKTVAYGNAASASVQSRVSLPYLCYLQTLARDHLLHRRAVAGERISTDDISDLDDDYAVLEKEFPELIPHAHVIRARRKMLRFIKTD